MSNSDTSLQNLIEKLKSIKDAMNYDISFHNLAKELESEINILSSPLTFMVMGSFSVGKSSFINAILGKSVAQVKATPTTAVITRFVYGKNETTTVYYNDDKSEVISESDFEKFTAETTKHDKLLRKNIKYVERVLNIDFLKNFTIIDSPGLNSNQLEHNDITKSFVDNADFIVWMLDAHWAAGANEIEHLQGLNKRFKPIVVVNQMDSLDEEEGDDPKELLEDIRIKCGKNVMDVIGVSAKMAIEGIERKNENFRKESNINGFFDIIDKYITNNKFFFKLDHLVEYLPDTLAKISKKKIELDTEDFKLRKNQYAKYVERWKNSMNFLSKYVRFIFDSWEIDDFDNEFLDKLFEENLANIENQYGFICSLNFGGNILLASDIRNAVFQNDPQAQYNEAMALRNEFGKGSNGEIYWLLLSGENGYAPAFKDLYMHYRDVNDTKSAIKWLELAAPKDDFAVACLACIFYFGENNVKSDKKTAMPWLLKAVSNRDYSKGELSFALANEYSDGVYIERDYQKAFELFNKSYTEGKFYALKNIADCYYNGIGIETDKLTAFVNYFNGGFANIVNDLYINSVENYPLQIEIAKNFQNGLNGFKKSIENAKKWFEIAFNNGYAEAGYLRAELAYNEYAKYEWYSKSADMGYGSAARKLGDLILKQGGRFSRFKAIKQYLRAILHSDFKAVPCFFRQSTMVFANFVLLLLIIHIMAITPLLLKHIDESSYLSSIPIEDKFYFICPMYAEESLYNVWFNKKNLVNINSIKNAFVSTSSLDRIKDEVLYQKLNNWLQQNDLSYSEIRFAHSLIDEHNDMHIEVFEFTLQGPKFLEEEYINTKVAVDNWHGTNKSLNKKLDQISSKLWNTQHTLSRIDGFYKKLINDGIKNVTLYGTDDSNFVMYNSVIESNNTFEIRQLFKNNMKCPRIYYICYSIPKEKIIQYIYVLDVIFRKLHQELVNA